MPTQLRDATVQCRALPGEALIFHKTVFIVHGSALREEHGIVDAENFVYRHTDMWARKQEAVCGEERSPCVRDARPRVG